MPIPLLPFPPSDSLPFPQSHIPPSYSKPSPVPIPIPLFYSPITLYKSPLPLSFLHFPLVLKAWSCKSYGRGKFGGKLARPFVIHSGSYYAVWYAFVSHASFMDASDVT